MTERAQWEYLTLVWVFATINATKAATEDQMALRGWVIHRPGEPAEKREDVDLPPMLAELGAEGWELVATDVLETTVTDAHLGWRKVTTPIRNRYIFKRPKESNPT